MNTETRLSRLEEKYKTLYQRTYARTVRRSELYEKENNRIKNWIRRMDGLPINRLATLCTKIKNGKRIVLVSKTEEHKLMKWLGKWGV